MIDLILSSYANIFLIVFLVLFKMGSIMEDVLNDEQSYSTKSESHSRRVSFSRDAQSIPMPLSAPSLSQDTSSAMRIISIRKEQSLQESILQLLVVWGLLAKRGSLGSVDEGLVICVCDPTGLVLAEQLISKLMPDTEQDLKSCCVRFAKEFEQVCTHVKAFTLKVTIPAHPSNKDTLFAIDVVISDDAFNLTASCMQPEWSLEYAELLLDTLWDLFGLVSDQPDTCVQDAVTVQMHEILKFRKWGSNLAEPLDRTIHSYFTEQAAIHPQKEAVISWHAKFSYAELDSFSNQLARRLQELGVKTGDAVPLCFEKSAWTVLAVCAVMKAGATFVLTDPSQPESRLRTIFEEVQARVLLTSINHESLGQRVAPQAKILVVGSRVLAAIETFSSDPLEPVAANELMYIIFTSGSTGKPKGVMISHCNYTSGAIPRADIVGYGSETRVLDLASYAFDVSIDCMLLTLATGGTICVPSDDDRVNNLSGAIRRMNVNMVHTTPSIARVFESDVIPSLKVLGLGGEAVPAREASEWNKQTRVLVAYGPSECTVGCAFQRWEDRKTYTSLGKGCGGTLWVVDPDNHERLSPIGVPGELVVEGPIVGPGYVNEPEKTAAAFVDGPIWLSSDFAGYKGRKGRLYKTGDLVRYDPDASGAVVFVGRKDQQVKIRGQRVELEEVEHHLRKRLPYKTALAAEVIHPGDNADSVLAAFVVEHDLKQEQTIDKQCSFSEDFRDLLSGLSEDLLKDVPQYMVPSSYIALSHIPTSVSGKTDRKQLRAIGSALSRKQLAGWRKNHSSHSQSRLLSNAEKTMSSLWQQVLGDADIAATDDFFVLGGDSLKAMRLVTLARNEGVGLTIRSIFSYPSLELMTRNASEDVPEIEVIAPFELLERTCCVQDLLQEAANICNAKRDEIEDIYPCTPLQEGLMALSAKVSEAYVAQRVLRLRNIEMAQRLKAAFMIATRDCPILRTRIVYVDTQGLLQVVLKPSGSWHESKDLDDYLETDRSDVMELGKPLCKFAIVTSNEGSIDIVLTMHHALYDGWSMPLVVDRINRAYNDMVAPVRTPFKNFIKWYQHQDRDASAAYWRSLLADAAVRQFPELPEPGYQTKADCLLEKYVPLTDMSTSNNTLASVIRGAWVLAASQHTNACDVVFGETLTGRNADCPGIEEIESVLITTVPMRVRLSTDMTVAAFLKMIHQQTIDRLPHEHFGLQNIRLLSKDARRACDLRTGLVLHPCEDGLSKITEGPASGLVPAGDAEAAQEALKFNSYALMLVCTLDKDGFLTMASFDSKTVTVKEMESLLDSFALNVAFLTGSTDQLLSKVINSTDLGLDRTVNAKAPKDTQRPANTISKADMPCIDVEVVQQLAKIWSKILQIDVGDINNGDEFFDLGGDSIGAMKLVSELKRSGYRVTVQDIFATKTLSAIANILTRNGTDKTITKSNDKSHHLTENQGRTKLPIEELRPLLQDQTWQIQAIYQARSLQDIAVKGTTDMPRYSVRYDQIFFHTKIDKTRLLKSCVDLVARNEILHTIFVRKADNCYGAVVDLAPDIVEYSIAGDLTQFCRSLCELDIQTLMPLGSSFVKFFLAQNRQDESCLILRISHAQYDEMCLPIMLRQLSQLYRGEDVEQSLPFSDWVHYTLKSIPASAEYWRDMLHESKMQKLPGPSGIVNNKLKLTSITKTVQTRGRPKNVTLATFPTAAWALCLARRLSSRDVIFGEVVSGRNTGFDDAEQITGPCWQYVPFRAQLEEYWTGLDLLKAVQHQHITSSQYEGMSLSEIVKSCTDWGSEVDWFDSVLHQAVAAVENLSFGMEDSRVETYYPHLEPLREWKIQAFVGDDEMTLEVVTFEEWHTFGQELLEDFVTAFEQLIARPEEKLVLDI